ncbi:Type II secretory pathway ATPase GspE/PulE or T4P pilus assembly pathway ATPase PilB [Trichlorobacter thiogenes]|uniref:Type II secretory pathway ATPase GspE/PulE or T4P pilus assembly pathway ATPase PilB n=1 Tax=Trichlorobacter thiogenes TaxID=115783 RepID=A0A1T4RNV2_9BACT|nr:ATPase, T2SS/T4P/T4SS family [Trichlorobacter thiogenes]SKA17351.1 Type II secretory pathway ATPase GspE/PulE or T4P pilus assembly pathway ATPase PilB [Trichlorobacter thiogenes]
MITKRLGELLIEQGLISQEQLDEALDMQKMFPDQTVGQLLCRLGYIRESDLSLVLDQKNKRRKLADIMLKEGLLDQQKLSQARELSRQNDIPLERALLKLRFVDEEQLARSVAAQYDLPYVEINSLSLDPGLARYISSVYAQKHLLVPISMIGNTLTLAMAQPLRHHDIRQLEDSIRLKIISVIASEASVLRALKSLYRVDLSSSTSAMDEVNLDLVPDSISELLNKTSAVDEPEVEEEVRKVTEKDSVIVKLVNKIIYDAYMKKASDIHIEPYPGKRDVTVRIRIDGQCIVYQKIPYKYKFAIPSRIKIMADLDIADRRRPQDGKVDFKKFGPLDIELRVATMPTVGQLEDVVIRVLTSGDPVSFERLGLTDRNRQVFERCLQSPYGLVLVVGPTGSGKTTTLHSGLATINSSNRKIWTAEDPVEISQIGLRQVQINPKIGFTFAAALRSFLRLDPDVIMVGEMRDEETAGIAVEASLTGHLVFSTLHTNSAPETVTRLLEMGLDPYSFSDSLLCVLAQRLARRLCSACKETYTPDQAELDELIEEYGRDAFVETGIDPSSITLAHAHGCEQCGQSGYHGRLGIHEVLDATDHLKYLVKRRADTDDIRTQAVQDGMTSLKQDGILKVFQGLTDIHEVRRVCIK